MRAYEKKTWKLRWLGEVMGFAGSYAIWILVFRLFILTVLTFFLVPQSPRLEDISEVISANEILIAGTASLSYLILIQFLHPIVLIGKGQIFTWKHFGTSYIPGLIRGAVLAGGILLAFKLAGLYEFLGVFLNIEDTLVVVGSVGTRILAVIALVYCEEFLFRGKILGLLREHFHDLQACVAISILYCLIKWIQFDLGIMQTLTLFLISIALSLSVVNKQHFTLGAGFLAGLLLVFHPLAGQPILGTDFHGLFLFKYQGSSGEVAGLLTGYLGEYTDSRLNLFITGGIGGPLSSFALQSMFMLYVLFQLAIHWSTNKRTT